MSAKLDQVEISHQLFRECGRFECEASGALRSLRLCKDVRVSHSRHGCWKSTSLTLFDFPQARMAVCHAEITVSIMDADKHAHLTASDASTAPPFNNAVIASSPPA
jgi:hypothetical protein